MSLTGKPFNSLAPSRSKSSIKSSRTRRSRKHSQHSKKHKKSRDHLKDLFKRKEEGPVRLTGLITQSTPLENENDLRNFIKNKKQILKKESLDKCKELEKSAQFYKTVQALHS